MSCRSFLEKRGAYFVPGTKVHPVYFTQFRMDIFFFSFTGDKRLAHVVVSHSLSLFDW